VVVFLCAKILCLQYYTATWVFGGI